MIKARLTSAFLVRISLCIVGRRVAYTLYMLYNWFRPTFLILGIWVIVNIINN